MTTKQIPTLASTFTNKVAAAFSPLNKFQQALYYRGFDKKPSAFAQWFRRNAAIFNLLEKVVFIAFVLFSIFTNPYLLFILPVIGGLVFYRNRVKWLWWKLKVFVLKRNYYQHRRELYKQGSLLHHLNHKRPKRFGGALIWGQSESIQTTIFRKLQKNNQLTTKEYIKL